MAKAGKTYFEEKCKTVAGEKIYRTVPDVEGVLLMKVRPERGQTELEDPMWPGAAFAIESSGERPVIVPQQAEQVATTRNLLRRGWCGVWLPDSGNTSEQSMQALFAARPRHPRLSAEHRGEAVLFQTIEQLISSHVQPA